MFRILFILFFGVFFVSKKTRSFPSNCLPDAIGPAGPLGVNLPDKGAVFCFFSCTARAQSFLRASPAGLEFISLGHLAPLSLALLPALWAARHNPTCPLTQAAWLAQETAGRGGKERGGLNYFLASWEASEGRGKKDS